MKKLSFILIALLLVFTSKAQIVNFTDPNFKIKLLESNIASNIAFNAANVKIKIDANGDGNIQVSEAAQVYKLDVSYTAYSNNVITSLVGIQYFTNLRSLNFSYSNINNSLDISALHYLESLYGYYGGYLGNINMTGLTTIQTIYLENCGLVSIDVSNLHQLQTLSVKSNQLSTLDLHGLTNLTFIDCGTNSLTSLDVSDSTGLTTLYCGSNLFTTLNFSANSNLANLKCPACFNMTSLFIKNGSINVPACDFLNSNLEYVCCDENNVYAIKLYYPNIATVNSYCSFVPGGPYYTVQGSNTFDADNNGCDLNDGIFSNLNYHITDSYNVGNLISNATGNYLITVGPGTQIITPVLENPNYFTVSPPYVEVTFPAQTSPVSQNFCLSPNGLHNDVEVVLLPINRARPGFDASYKIIYKNKGTTTTSGSVSFSFEDDKMDFIVAYPAVTSQTTSNLLWDYSNLHPLESREIEITLNINSPLETTAVHIGDQLNFTAIITPIITDEMPTNNTSPLKQIVVGSVDPNDKICMEGTLVTPDIIGDYVHYIIHFENTGTANAQNIVVKDMIDNNKFDIDSLVPLSGSGSFVTRIMNTNQVEFIFENINLPFDITNNDGYVAFKIKTKPTLVVGDTFSNNATIYFDYNAPIVTNTYSTTIATLGNQNFDFGSVFTLSPVPAKNSLTITSKQDMIMTSISIYNALGQLVQVNTNPTETIDVSALKTGNYFIKIISDKGTVSSKFIKE